jgi:putative glutamine amidotransferase
MKLIGITGPSTFTGDVINMIEKFMGANPVLLYMDDDANLDYWVSKVSAVFLCGGVDLHPMTYNRSFPSRKNMKLFDLRRDRREIKVIDRCLASRVPMFGICRGHQLLGVCRKDMTLITDLCDDSSIIHCPSVQEPKFSPDPNSPIHKVEILTDRTLFNRPVTKEAPVRPLWVNSFHHQGLLYEVAHEKDPHVLGVSYVNKDKNIVELMECPEERWMSCQWHPEYDYKEQSSSRKLLQYFKEKYIGDCSEVEMGTPP